MSTVLTTSSEHLSLSVYFIERTKSIDILRNLYAQIQLNDFILTYKQLLFLVNSVEIIDNTKEKLI